MDSFGKSSFSTSVGGYSKEQIEAETVQFMVKVYAIMAAGLAVTGITSFAVASSTAAVELVFGNRLVFYGLLGAQLLVVFAFSSIAARASAWVAGAMFFFYAFLTGITFSVIFLVYTLGSIASTFCVTAGSFAALSAFGMVTKRDLTGVGNFMFIGLIGLLLTSIVNIFLQSPMVTWVTSCIGVIVFAGLTAYDTQKIKAMNVIGNEGTDADHKEAINGALTLYLDFINLFLYLLRLLGNRR